VQTPSNEDGVQQVVRQPDPCLQAGLLDDLAEILNRRFDQDADKSQRGREDDKRDQCECKE